MASLFQFSIRGLLWGITVLAVGFAALVNANGIWHGLIWGLAVYALGVSILMVIYRREEVRAYWLGFGVCGGLYLLLLFCSQHHWLSVSAIRYDNLLVTQLADWSHQTLLPESRRTQYILVQQPADPLTPGGPPGADPMSGIPGVGYASMDGMGTLAGPMGPGDMTSAMMMSRAMTGQYGGPVGAVQTPNPQYVPLESFTHILHALALLAAAAVGGMTCRFIYRTRPRAED